MEIHITVLNLSHVIEVVPFAVLFVVLKQSQNMFATRVPIIAATFNLVNIVAQKMTIEDGCNMKVDVNCQHKKPVIVSCGTLFLFCCQIVMMCTCEVPFYS